MAYKDKEKHREVMKDWYQKNKESVRKQHHEYYLAHREEICQRTRKYHHENNEWRDKYYKGHYEEKKLEVLARIDPARKCARCGCDDTRFLEVNHIKGGGGKERKKRGKKVTGNMILLIYHKKRGVEDLNILCRLCNALDHLERVHGPTRLRVVWDKPVINTPVSLSKSNPI